MIGVEVIGTRDLQNDLNKYGVEGEKAINKAVSDTSKAIETDAKNRLRGGLGSAKHWIYGALGRSIYNRVVQSMEKVVGTPVKYAPYIEFGIGEMVFTNMEFTAEERAVAAQFKGQKKVKGFKGDSFLNWAAHNQEKKLIERIEKNLNDLNK